MMAPSLTAALLVARLAQAGAIVAFGGSPPPQVVEDGARRLGVEGDPQVLLFGDHPVLGTFQARAAGQSLALPPCPGPALDQAAWLQRLDAAKSLALDTTGSGAGAVALAQVTAAQLCVTERLDPHLVLLPFLYEGRLRYLQGDREGARTAFEQALLRASAADAQWVESWVRDNTAMEGAPPAVDVAQAALARVDALGHAFVRAAVPPGVTLLVDGQARAGRETFSLRPGDHLVQVADTGAAARTWGVRVPAGASVVMWVPPGRPGYTDLYDLDDALRRLLRVLPAQDIPDGFLVEAEGQWHTWRWDGLDLVRPQEPARGRVEAGLGWSLASLGAGLALGSGALVCHTYRTPLDPGDDPWLTAGWAGVAGGAGLAAAGVTLGLDGARRGRR